MARIVSTAAINAIRNDYNVYNPVSLAYEDSILLEGSRSNLALYSENLSLAADVGSSAILYSLDSAIAPDGTLTADKLIADTTLAVHYHRQDTGLTVAGEPISVSRYLKAGEITTAILAVANGASCTVTFNLATGVIISAAGADHLRSSITSLGNGWYRCTATATSTGLNHRFLTYPGSNTAAYSGDGTSGIYCWGGQIETNSSFPSSYIPTTNVAVTRAGEDYSIPFTLPPQEMTVYIKFIEKGFALAGGGQRLFTLGNVGATNTLLINAPSGNYQAYHHNGSVAVTRVIAVESFGTQVELRIVLGSNGSLVLGKSANGGTESVTAASSAATLASAWASPSIIFGTPTFVAAPYIALQNFKIARGTLTLAQMRAL